MEISIEKIAEYAKKYCDKIPKGTLNGNSKTVITFEINSFLRFAKKEVEKEKIASQKNYVVEVSEDSTAEKVDNCLSFMGKIILYSRGIAIKKAGVFHGKAKLFTGKINSKKHYIS